MRRRSRLAGLMQVVVYQTAMIVLSGATSLTGCTFITLESTDGAVRFQRHFGTILVDLLPNSDAQIAKVAGVGLFSTPTGFVAGYHSQTIAALPTSCRLVLWIETEEELKLLSELLDGNLEVCAVRDTNNGGSS